VPWLARFNSTARAITFACRAENVEGKVTVPVFARQGTPAARIKLDVSPIRMLRFEFSDG